MTDIVSALEWARGELSFLGSPQLEAEVLLGAVLDKDRAFLKGHGDFEISAEFLCLYKKFIQKRAQNIPVAYIIGYKPWCDLDIMVNASVLIPRDETEILVEFIVSEIQNNKEKSLNEVFSILDVGTGSGAVAMALGQKLKGKNKQIKILGSDISSEALIVAKANAEKHQVVMDLVESDLLDHPQIKSQTWDIIVANLPYVPEALPIAPEVGKEPHQALFSGVDGLDHYRRLALELGRYEVDFDQLWIEFLPQQKVDIKSIFQKYQIDFKSDVGGDVYFACLKRVIS